MPEQNLQDKILELENEVENLRRERTILRSLLEIQPVASYARDANLRYLFSNEAHRKTIGAESLEDVIGKGTNDFFDGEIATNVERSDQGIIERGELYREDGQYPIVTGELIWHRTTKQPVFDETGNLIGLVGTTKDITEEKRKQEIIEHQQAALSELGNPIIPIAEGIVILPLIGDIDSQRALNMMRTVLAGISEHNAQVVIIDITGVPLVDTGVAAYFNRTVQAVKLKGASTIITGITEAVAESIVDLGIDWGDVATLPDLQTGLKRALELCDSEL